MAIIITDECINCGACEPECPNNAIYEGADSWRFSDGTSMTGSVKGKNSGLVTDKCTECVGFHDEPQCAAVCPVDCCVDDPDWRETEEELLSKKEQMHL